MMDDVVEEKREKKRGWLLLLIELCCTILFLAFGIRHVKVSWRLNSGINQASTDIPPVLSYALFLKP